MNDLLIYRVTCARLKGANLSLIRVSLSIIFLNDIYSTISTQLFYPSFFRNMSLRLKFAEIQAASAEREAAKLQNELDILLDDVDDWKAKYEEICEELEQTFYEMSEY